MKATPESALACSLVGAAFKPGPLDVQTPVQNPLGSRGVERQQLTWFLFVGLIVFVAWSAAQADAASPADWSTVSDLGWTIFLIAIVLGIPAAIGIAILRHNLYSIDVVINRTLVYGTLTAGLLATYVMSVLVLRPLLSPLTGDSGLAVAGSTALPRHELDLDAVARDLRTAAEDTMQPVHISLWLRP